MPGNDIEKAKADIFSEAIYDLENAFIRAVADPDKNQQVKHDYHITFTETTAPQNVTDNT